MKTRELQKIFSVKTVLLLLILWIAANLWMSLGANGSLKLKELTGESRIPDTMISGYNVADLNELLTQYGNKGREIYLSVQNKDFIYPLIYSTLLAGLLVRVKLPGRLGFVVFLPWIAAVFDYAENLTVRKLVVDFPVLKEGFVNAASFFTLIKWDLIFISIAFILIFGIPRLLRKKTA